MASHSRVRSVASYNFTRVSRDRNFAQIDIRQFRDLFHIVSCHAHMRPMWFPQRICTTIEKRSYCAQTTVHQYISEGSCDCSPSRYFICNFSYRMSEGFVFNTTTDMAPRQPFVNTTLWDSLNAHFKCNCHDACSRKMARHENVFTGVRRMKTNEFIDRDIHDSIHQIAIRSLLYLEFGNHSNDLCRASRRNIHRFEEKNS